MPVMIFNSKTGKFSNKNRFGGSYSGEKDLGNLNNWSLFDPDSNLVLDTTYGLLSARSTTLYHTYPPARGAINKQTDYSIGPGLVFRSQPDAETLGRSKDWGVSWGKEFQKIVDSYYRRFGFYGKQGFLFRSALYGGDSLLMFLREKGLLTDLIETLNTEIDWEKSDKDTTLGIKHDKWLRREAVVKTDGTTVDFKDKSGNQNVIQFYIKELARQLRGYPLIYAAINLARSDDSLNDSIRSRAVLESNIFGVAKTEGQTDVQAQMKAMAEANRQNKGGSESTRFKTVANSATLGMGNILTMGTSESMEFTDMKAPSNNYAPFMDVTRDYLGMATGTPSEVIASKYNTSFTAHKGAFNDFIKSFMYKRSVFGRTVGDVVNLEIAKDAVRQGFISAPGLLSGNWRVEQAYLRGMFLGPVPGHINPMVEVKAQAASVDNGFKLRSDIATMNGHEYESFQSEWAKEQEEFTSHPQKFAERVFNQERDLEGQNNDG